MTDELITAKLEALGAKLDLLIALAQKPPVSAQPSEPAYVLPAKVQAALMRRGGSLPRETRIRMRVAAQARLMSGEDESAVIRAIEVGEGSDHPQAQSLMASI